MKVMKKGDQDENGLYKVDLVEMKSLEVNKGIKDDFNQLNQLKNRSEEFK
jgi:hypothetical protein